MPWEESTVLDERTRFIAALLEGRSMTEVCRQFGVSRKTGYKWLDRYEAKGPQGLEDRSRAPISRPHAVSEEVVRLILDLRRKHPSWGPKKLEKHLSGKRPDLAFPSLSTFGEIVKRHGLTTPRKRRRHVPPYQQPFIGVEHPNSVWTADFKGDFLTGDRTRCYPLTIADCHSRYLLRCQALTSTSTEQAQPIFKTAFEEYGLPAAIRTDNGSPFASTGVTALTKLSVWFIKLGIVPERIEPGHPEQNGRHERMHRTLKEETATPPKATLTEQQKTFNAFKQEYNYVRPHEALGMETPASLYEPSPRILPRVIEPPEYDTSVYEVRKVTGIGISWFNRRHFLVSRALAGEHIGLRYLGKSVWVVRFCFLDLGILDMRQVGDHIKMQPLPPNLSWDAARRISVDASEDQR
jgi:transposase InsO family protein